MLCWVIRNESQAIKVNDHRQANPSLLCSTEIIFIYPNSLRSSEAWDIFDMYYYNRPQDSPAPYPVKDAEEIDATLSIYQEDMASNYYDRKFKALRDEVGLIDRAKNRCEI